MAILRDRALVIIKVRILVTHSYVCVCVCVCEWVLSCVWLFATPWTEACQSPLSMGFSQQECWSGLPCPPPGDLPSPGSESASPALAGSCFTTEPPGKPIHSSIGAYTLKVVETNGHLIQTGTGDQFVPFGFFILIKIYTKCDDFRFFWFLFYTWTQCWSIPSLLHVLEMVWHFDWQLFLFHDFYPLYLFPFGNWLPDKEILWLHLLQSSPTLCDPMDCSLPGSSVRGILRARILESVAMPSSKTSSWPRDRTRISYI